MLTKLGFGIQWVPTLKVHGQMAMGQNPVPPVNIPIPTKIGSKMGGQNGTVGFDPQPNGMVHGTNEHRRFAQLFDCEPHPDCWFGGSALLQQRGVRAALNHQDGCVVSSGPQSGRPDSWTKVENSKG